MLRKHVLGLFILSLILTGCASVPLATLFKLRKIDPMEVDPKQLKVAIRVDERIGIPKGGAQISLKFDAEDGSLHIDDTYIVDAIRNSVFALELYEGKNSGESVTLLQLTDGDAKKMTRALSLLRAYGEGKGKGTLSFGVDIRGVCTHGPLPANKVPVDIFIQAKDNDGFLALTKNMDLRKSRDGFDAMLDNLPVCVESPVTGSRNRL